MKSAWIIDTDYAPSSEPILEYINEQGKMLEEDTKGRVKGMLLHGGTSFRDSIALLQAIATPVYSPTQHEDMKNASELYNKQTYEFFIVDKKHNYELSVFKITCNDKMPVSLSVDPTIASESGVSQKSDINSLETFQKEFDRIVTSRKVRYIIMKLMELPETEETTIMKEELDTNPDSLTNGDTKKDE